MYGIVVLICMLFILEIWRKKQVKKAALKFERRYKLVTRNFSVKD